MRVSAIAVAALLVVSSMHAEAAPTYHAVALTPLPTGNNTGVYGLNNLGQVAGYSNGVDLVSGGGTYAAVWDAPNSIHSLGLLDPSLAGSTQSFATAINDSGSSVGWSGSAWGPRAFFFNGTMHDIGTLSGSGNVYAPTYAYGVNGANQIVGTSLTASGWYHAFVTMNGSLVDLGTLGGPSHTTAYGINDKGQVVGTDAIAGAWLWDNGTMYALGALPGGVESRALSLNNAGTVVGVSTSVFGEQAFVYSAGSMSGLGVLPGFTTSAAYDINADGDVVGRSVMASGFGHATLFSGGQILDLNDLIDNGDEWVLFDAKSINDHGDIVGEGTWNGTGYSFLLQRADTTVSEPSVVALLAAAFLASGVRRRATQSVRRSLNDIRSALPLA